MLTLKDYAFIAGLILFLLGIGCLPLGGPGNPKRDLSLFNNFADLGAFSSTGIVLIVTGLTILVITGLSVAFAATFRRLTATVRIKPVSGWSAGAGS